MTIDIIGAGLGRTGTMSLKKALEKLGYNKCYHMAELAEHPEHVSHWRALHEGRPADLDALFTGYRATVDFPGATFYREFMSHYPEAKVILSVRDAQSWHESAMKTIYSAGPRGMEKLALMLKLPFNPRLRKLAPVMKFVSKMIWTDMFQGRFEDRNFAIDFFEQHNQAVKSFVPADKLLVYELGQGWEPLCEFLGCEVPDEPYPHVNKREDFDAKRRQILSGKEVELT